MKMFSGVSTALITPFKDGEVDYASFEKLVMSQKKNGVQNFVVHGTTAESPTLKSSEKKEIFQQIRKWVGNEFPLIVGTGSNSTAQTIEDSKEAERWGADGLLVVVPYYNKPPQRGLFEHFKSVAAAVQLPCLLYNVPGRTITSLEIETIKRLSQIPHILGIKEASGNIDFAKQIRQSCGKEFLLLSGDDCTYDDFMKVGGDGTISVASHIIPKALLDVKAGEYKDLIDLLFVEPNPIPVKMALFLLGVIQSPELRLPLVTMSPAGTEKLKAALQKKRLL